MTSQCANPNKVEVSDKAIPPTIFWSNYRTIWEALWFLGMLGFLSTYLFSRYGKFFPVLFVFTFLVYFIGALSIVFGRKRLVSIKITRITLYPGFPGFSPILINLEEIKNIRVAPKPQKMYFNRFGFVNEIELDALIFTLNAPLTGRRENIVNSIKSSIFSNYSQIDTNKTKNEIWLKNPPRKGFDEILSTLSNLVPLTSNFHPPKTLILMRILGFVFYFILIVSFLAWVYLYAVNWKELLLNVPL